MRSLLIHIGRSFLGLYFLIPGIGKFLAWDSSLALMETHNMKMVPVLLAISGMVQVFGGISLLLNKHVVICSVGFAFMIILININLHDFWNVYDGVSADHEAQNFFKNLGIFAGLLLLAALNIKEPSKKDR